MSAELKYQDNIAIITLKRPEARNALNAEMIAKLQEFITEIAPSTYALQFLLVTVIKHFVLALILLNCRTKHRQCIYMRYRLGKTYLSKLIN